MATTINNATATIKQEAEQTVRVFKKRVFFFFTQEVQEVVRTGTIANDLFVRTDRAVRNVFINNVEYVEKPLTPLDK